MVGKTRSEIRVAYIENACDVYDDEASLIEGRAVIEGKGYDVELVDLRNWVRAEAGLREKLESKDVFWFTGGNVFYLRWVLKASAADEIITDLVKQGKVYVGASAGGVVAGPTLHFFEDLDDPNDAPEQIWGGLSLTQIVPVPHVDNAEFGEGCRKANEDLKNAGYKTQPITDT
jgi:dipeptidase E